MRLLLIEDDRKAARLLAKGLQEEGFVVDVAPTGEDGEEKAAVNEYDLIVLDWLLPGKDGLAVCRALRACGSSTPILMLTARDSVADRVSGLSTGADDFLTKPFAFAELLARIRALLRASSSAKAKGLVRKSSAPVLRPLTRSATLSRAVSIRIGVELPHARRARQTASPSFPGRSQSSTIRSYSFTAAFSSPSSPVGATSTTKPSS